MSGDCVLVLVVDDKAVIPAVVLITDILDVIPQVGLEVEVGDEVFGTGRTNVSILVCKGVGL